jgi:predicted ATPase
LLGRESELGVLRHAITTGVTGAGRVVLVEGDPGIGKSALVASAIAASGVPSVSASTSPLNRRRPFALLVEALGGELGGLRRRGDAEAVGADPPEADPPEASDVAPGSGEAILSAFAELGALGPMVVLLEDLHWADDATLELLGAVGGSILAEPTTLVCTARRAPRSPELSRLVTRWSRQGVLTRVELGPLGAAECVALGEWLVGARFGARLVEQVGRAGGNPLFVTELVAALVRDGSIQAQGPAGVELAGGAKSATLPMTILHHLGRVLRAAAGGPRAWRLAPSAR